MYESGTRSTVKFEAAFCQTCAVFCAGMRGKACLPRRRGQTDCSSQGVFKPTDPRDWFHGDRNYQNANMSSELILLFRLRMHGDEPPSLTPLHMSTATEQTPSKADSFSADQKHFRLLRNRNVHYRFHNSAL